MKAFKPVIEHRLIESIGQPRIRDIDSVFNAFIKHLILSKVKSIALAQSGDFCGGEGWPLHLFRRGEISRKIMNAFFFATASPVKFMGRINEDVNLYTANGLKGDVFITHPFVRLQQLETQTNTGGLTEIYLDLGTYVKSFYSVMYAPSCVKIHVMGVNQRRIHHRVSWNNAVPKILNQSHKKAIDA